MTRDFPDGHRFALVAHDVLKPSIVEWVGANLDLFRRALVFFTGTTRGLLSKAYPDLDITALKSGPLGGDQQIGATICQGTLDAPVFLVDPLSPMSHDVDVKALTRLATAYDIPMACNKATADLIMAGFRHIIQ